MKIVVYGAGGVGGYFGGRLALAGEDVTFIARGATLGALRSRGLRVESLAGDFELDSVAATDDPASVGEADAILVAVKSWQVPAAAAAMKPMVGPKTMVVPLENGMDAPGQLAAVLGEANVLGGLCALVSYIVEPGHIRHAGAEPTVAFGELDNRRSERAQRLLDAFTRAGVRAEIPPDIHRSMWTKFLFIVPMSGIGAITRVPIGVWRTMPETRVMAERALRELIALARRRGVDPGDDAFERTMQRYDALDAAATSSLQRDVMEGKPSELDAQVGAVVRMAGESAVPAPVHQFIYHCLLPQERRSRGDA
jgi:2-dehydropantoate 2-reductase